MPDKNNPTQTGRRRLSVVVPCFNEEQVIDATHQRLTQVMLGLRDFDYEILYVDDGSRDMTLEKLRALQGTDSHVRFVALSRNFGHQIAITAGLHEANGDAVIVIDADLQDPPRRHSPPGGAVAQRL